MAAIAVGCPEAPPETGAGGVGDQGQLCAYIHILRSTYKYMGIGNGQCQQEGLDLTVGAHIALGDEAGNVHVHGCWCYLWEYVWQRGPTVYMCTAPGIRLVACMCMMPVAATSCGCMHVVALGPRALVPAMMLAGVVSVARRSEFMQLELQRPKTVSPHE